MNRWSLLNDGETVEMELRKNSVGVDVGPPSLTGLEEPPTQGTGGCFSEVLIDCTSSRGSFNGTSSCCGPGLIPSPAGCEHSELGQAGDWFGGAGQASRNG